MKSKEEFVMKKGFKLLSLLMTCLFVFVLATGCGSSDNKSGSGDKKGETANLIWWCVGDQPKDLNVVQAEINKYLKEKVNATVEFKFASFADYSDKMNKVIASGEDYDLAFTSSWGNPFVLNARKGAYYKLDDLLNEYGKDLKELIPEELWQAATVNGNIYAIPTYKDTALAPYYVFAKEYVDKYNIDYKNINTLEKLEPALKTIKENEPSMTPLVLTGPEGWHGLFSEFDMIINNDIPVGVQVTDETATVVNPFTTDTIKSKLNTLHKYYKAGYINKDAPTLTDPPKFRFVYGADGFPYADVSWTQNGGYDVVSTLRYQPYFTTGSVQGSMQAISVNSEHPEAAMEVLNLANSDSKFRNMLAYGIEGKNYEKTGDNTIKVLNDGWNAAAFSQATFFNGLYAVDPAPGNMWDDVKKFNGTAKSSPILGFVLDDSKIQTQLAVVKNAYAKYKAQVTTGVADPNEVVPKMIKDLEDAGINDVIKEAQDQINAWKASK
jgi:putative aldouronate transport system substrate-binding protein